MLKRRLAASAPILAFASCTLLGTRTAETMHPAPTTVTLERRADGSKDYGLSAYSFQHSSSDPTVHNNYVDLVYNNCGELHFNAYGGQENRIARLTGKTLDDVRNRPRDGWSAKSFKPELGSLYALDIDDGCQREVVKFQVTQVSEDKVTIQWAPLRRHSTAPAGEMGTCGVTSDLRN